MRRRPTVHWITADSLPDVEKQALWAGIKQLDPALAAMLKTDQNISALKASLGATLRFTKPQADKYIAAGRQFFEERNRDRHNHQLLQN